MVAAAGLPVAASHHLCEPVRGAAAPCRSELLIAVSSLPLQHASTAHSPMFSPV